jgi:hypothetical protein
MLQQLIIFVIYLLRLQRGRERKREEERGRERKGEREKGFENSRMILAGRERERETVSEISTK